MSAVVRTPAPCPGHGRGAGGRPRGAAGEESAAEKDGGERAEEATARTGQTERGPEIGEDGGTPVGVLEHPPVPEAGQLHHIDPPARPAATREPSADRKGSSLGRRAIPGTSMSQKSGPHS